MVAAAGLSLLYLRMTWLCSPFISVPEYVRYKPLHAALLTWKLMEVFWLMKIYRGTVRMNSFAVFEASWPWATRASRRRTQWRTYSSPVGRQEVLGSTTSDFNLAVYHYSTCYDCSDWRRDRRINGCQSCSVAVRGKRYHTPRGSQLRLSHLWQPRILTSKISASTATSVLGLMSSAFGAPATTAVAYTGCPENNNTVYTSTYGNNKYQIYCNQTITGYLGLLYIITSTFQLRMEACSSRTGAGKETVGLQ